MGGDLALLWKEGEVFCFGERAEREYFNEVLSMREVRGSGGRSVSQVCAFHEVITKLGLGYLGMRGREYTWFNKG